MHMSTYCIPINQVCLLAVLNRFVWHVRRSTERFSAPGSSDSQLYLVDVELVTSAGLTPFLLVSKSAATSGETVSNELHSHSLCPTQQGHPLALLGIRLFGEACQLCTLPFGHCRQHHQTRFVLPSVVLSGKHPFSLFLLWSHCSSKVCCASAKVGCFCLEPSALLPPFACAHLGQPVLSCALCPTPACHSCKQALHFQWALMLLETVTWSGDSGWFLLASQNSATCGAFVASVLCWHTAVPEQKGQPFPRVLLYTAASQTCGRPSGHWSHDHQTLRLLPGLMLMLPRCKLRCTCHWDCSPFASKLILGPTSPGCSLCTSCMLSLLMLV